MLGGGSLGLARPKSLFIFADHPLTRWDNLNAVDLSFRQNLKSDSTMQTNTAQYATPRKTGSLDKTCNVTVDN